MKHVALVSLLLTGMLVSGPVAADDLEQVRSDAREAAMALMTELGGVAGSFATDVAPTSDSFDVSREM